MSVGQRFRNRTKLVMSVRRENAGPVHISSHHPHLMASHTTVWGSLMFERQVWQRYCSGIFPEAEARDATSKSGLEPAGSAKA